MSGKRIRSLNENAFSKITPTVAYWLGFITADGCIRKSSSYCLKILLSEKDVSHLEKIKKFLKSNHSIWNGGNNGKGVQFNSKILYDDLQKWGIEPRKTYSKNDFLKPIPEKYRDYFIIGLLDGDGSIIVRNKSITHKKTYTYEVCTFRLLSNYKTLESICEHLNNKHNIKINKISLSVKRSIVYQCSWSGKNELLKFYNIYSKSPVKLQRKFDKLEKFINNHYL